MKRAILDQLLADRDAKRSVVLATTLETGEQALIYPLEHRDDADPTLIQAARDAVRRDQSTTVDTTGGEIFLRVYNPPLRLVIVGAVHIAQALCPIAALLGFEVIVVDPRSAFASPERFPDITVSTEWPDQALAAVNIDHRTAVVTLTHDPKIDEPALTCALASDAFYIGALGSKKTQARRLNRLREQGLGDDALDRIHGPVGLDIGARSAAEIALAIAAQMVARLRRTDHRVAV